MDTIWTDSRWVIFFISHDSAVSDLLLQQGFFKLFFIDLSQAGDTVGVVRKEDGSLHFFVNGVPQGPAAWNVPPSVYAVVDLYGQAAQATIMDDMGKKRKDNSLDYLH